MFEGYKVIAVIPAGRKRYLEVLLPYLLRDLTGPIDECHFWLNTNVSEDVSFIKNTCNKSKILKVIEPAIVPKAVWRDGEPDNPLFFGTIYKFFENCIDENTIYIRFDDDVCYIEKSAIYNLLSCRINNPDHILIYPYIINNEMNYVKELIGTPLTNKKNNVENAITRHVRFLNAIDTVQDFFISNFESRAKLHINCICWFGSDFAKFSGIVGDNQSRKNNFVYEEDWIINKSLELKKSNLVCGSSIVSHFAFHNQRLELEKTNLLQKYKNVLPKVNLF